MIHRRDTGDTDMAQRCCESEWQLPNAELSLPRTEVHVWRASLDQPQALTNYFPTLAPEEKERAARFHFQKDREHFIAARGLLRAILSRYLKERPDRLAFGYGPRGKPFLVGQNSGDVHFNVSHPRCLALYAI